MNKKLTITFLLSVAFFCVFYFIFNFAVNAIFNIENTDMSNFMIVLFVSCLDIIFFIFVAKAMKDEGNEK